MYLSPSLRMELASKNSWLEKEPGPSLGKITWGSPLMVSISRSSSTTVPPSLRSFLKPVTKAGVGV